MPAVWRLLNFITGNPKMEWAVNEAIFRSRRTGLAPDTLRLWQGSASVVLGAPSSFKDDVNHENCIKNGVEIVRANSVSPEVFYYDMGSLNFAFAIDTSELKQFIKNYQPVLSEYQLLNECIAVGLNKKFRVTSKADATGVYINNKKVSESLQVWFYDYLLFQGIVHINTNLSIYNQVTRFKKQLTTLKLEIGEEIPVGDVINALVQGVEEKLDVKFNEQRITEEEQKLIQKLYRVKYSLDKWNISGREPFLIGMGKTTVEVFVAYPPTSKCRELIDLVKNVTSDLQNEVEIRVWMRGRGINQHGPCPEISPVLKYVEKHSTLPAIIINGELKFSESIPSKEDLRKAILEVS
jgi:lipoate-protein ligase A